MTTYILDSEGNPVPEPDTLKWGRWMELAERHLGDDTIGNSRISTVFLGIDHQLANGQPPLLYETMIFANGRDDYCERYSTRSEALAGHAKAVEMVKNDAVPSQGESR